MARTEDLMIDVSLEAQTDIMPPTETDQTVAPASKPDTPKDYFSDLPLEIRQKIYSYLLTDQVVQIVPNWCPCDSKRFGVYGTFPKLTLTKAAHTGFLLSERISYGIVDINTVINKVIAIEPMLMLYRAWHEDSGRPVDGANLSLVSKTIREEVAESKLRSDLYIQVIGGGTVDLSAVDKPTLDVIESVLFCPGPEIDVDHSSFLALLPRLKVVSFSPVELGLYAPKKGFSLKAFRAGLLLGKQDAYNVLLTLGFPLFPEHPEYYGKDGTILTRQLVVFRYNPWVCTSTYGLNLVFAMEISGCKKASDSLHIIYCDSTDEGAWEHREETYLGWEHLETAHYALSVDIADRSHLLYRQGKADEYNPASASETIDQLEKDWQESAAVAHLGAESYGGMAIWYQNSDRIGFTIENIDPLPFNWTDEIRDWPCKRCSRTAYIASGGSSEDEE